MTSIIIPHHNRSGLLRETLGSLQAQTDADWEAVVVDHVSTAAEREAAEAACSEDLRIRFLVREGGPIGPSASRNLGLREAKGEFAIFLDSDDLLASDCLERRLREIEADPGLDFAVFNARLFESVAGDREDCWNDLGPEDRDGDLLRFLSAHAPWCVSGPIWRIEAIRRLGGFDEAVFYGDDAELHIRAILAGLVYRKASAARGPDHFIRRSSEVPRATQGRNPVVEASRPARLTATTRALKREDAPAKLFRLWEGQYVGEAEFHLFRNRDHRVASEAIGNVLSLWKRDFAPPLLQRVLLGAYLRVALRTRERAYLLLRISRRLVIFALPSEFFGKRHSD